MTVEDSRFERELIIRYLKKAGYNNIIEADSAEEAIKKYKKENPDLVLMDLRLPGINGLECFKELKKINPTVKVIMLTIIVREEEIDKANKLGAKDYLVKPITEGKLISSIEGVIKK